jgi:hypothetical protein
MTTDRELPRQLSRFLAGAHAGEPRRANPLPAGGSSHDNVDEMESLP